MAKGIRKRQARSVGLPRVERPSSSAREGRPLVPERAFVVQFRARTEAGEQSFEGRAEHIASGEVAHFSTASELLDLLARVLSEIG